MRRSILAVMALSLIILPGLVSAGSLPVSFSAKGGIGTGSFAMDELNDELSRLRDVYGGNAASIDGGFQVYLEGRVWFFDRIAVLAGYEHFWADTELDPGDEGFIFEAPADVLLLGGVVNVFKFPKLVDLNIGARGNFTKPVYGSNETDGGSSLDEFKNNSYGWDIFAEATTNFLRPFEVGIMLGYRNVKISDLEDKRGDIALHESGSKVELDYSGTFFYLTAGIRLW